VENANLPVDNTRIKIECNARNTLGIRINTASLRERGPAKKRSEKKNRSSGALAAQQFLDSKQNRNSEERQMASGMTKTAIVRHMAERNALSNKQSAAFLESLADTAIKETKKSGMFTIPGLGKLVKAERKARMGRNPQTGEAIKIKARTVVKFRVAKAAKDAIAPPKK
jgi:DNA-binding protein HU-beta